MDKGAIEDRYVYNEIKTLIQTHGIETIVETGTYYGWSAKKLSEFGLPVYTIEVNPEFLAKAKLHTNDTKNIFHYLGSSPQTLSDILEERNLGKTLYFLDAHWGVYWPIHDELKVMKDNQLRPIILIHDFYVPDTNGNPKFGFDVYKGQPLNYAFVKQAMDELYGDGEYIHYCIQEAEVNAGVGVFVPVGEVK